VARQRCWRYDWVLDLDIKSFFDRANHDRLMARVAGGSGIGGFLGSSGDT